VTGQTEHSSSCKSLGYGIITYQSQRVSDTKQKHRLRVSLSRQLTALVLTTDDDRHHYDARRRTTTTTTYDNDDARRRRRTTTDDNDHNHYDGRRTTTTTYDNHNHYDGRRTTDDYDNVRQPQPLRRTTKDDDCCCYFHLMAVFPHEPWSAGSHWFLSSLLHLFQTRISGNRKKGFL